jgi:hypothetical protein
MIGSMIQRERASAGWEERNEGKSSRGEKVIIRKVPRNAGSCSFLNPGVCAAELLKIPFGRRERFQFDSFYNHDINVRTNNGGVE